MRKDKYEGTMDQELANTTEYQQGRHCVHSPNGSTFLHEMTSWEVWEQA